MAPQSVRFGVRIELVWSVIGWATKNLLSRASLCFGRHNVPSEARRSRCQSRWYWLHLQSLTPTNLHWALVARSPYVLSIRKACAPAVQILIIIG
jgi:hypothetical protein